MKRHRLWHWRVVGSKCEPKLTIWVTSLHAFDISRDEGIQILVACFHPTHPTKPHAHKAMETARNTCAFARCHSTRISAAFRGCNTTNHVNTITGPHGPTAAEKIVTWIESDVFVLAAACSRSIAETGSCQMYRGSQTSRRAVLLKPKFRGPCKCPGFGTTLPHSDST